MSRSRSRRVVLLLDCCYAGPFERGMTARAGAGVGIEAHFGGRGRAVITASSAMEYAFEGGELADSQDLQPSVFTSALVEGLQTGEADRDQDGMVALDELYDYVYDKVRAAIPNQTPGKWTFGVQGDLYIARRARPVTTPTLLPPQLQEAIDSPFAAVRAAAVQELVRLLQGRHAGLAVGARLALQRLTEDDSRTVAAAAAQAFVAPAPPTPPEPTPPTPPPEPTPPMLAPSATVVDFGKLSLRGQSPERTVRLDNAGGGSLNARATTPASWLQLRQDGDDLVVTVDTSSAGEYEDIINVNSDGGSATIRVLARVEPAPLPGPVPAPSTHPEAAPAAPDRERPGLQKDAALPGTDPALADSAPPVAAAPTPTMDASGAAAPPTAGPISPPVGVDDRAAPRPRDDRLLLIAARLAIAGAVLAVLGSFPTYNSPYDADGESLWDVNATRWYVVIGVAVVLTAGVCMFIPRTRRLIGPGLLLGVAAFPIWALVNVVGDSRKGPKGGLWLELAASLILVLAACLAGLALARAAEARLMRQPAQGAFPRAVALLGLAGALALVFHDQNLSSARQHSLVAPSIWATVIALVVPACASVAVPRRFGVSILIGWIGFGAAYFVYYGFILDDLQRQGTHISSSPIIAFGVTLLALLIVATPFAHATPTSRADPTSQVEPTTRG